jgi:hypothetical protein
LARSSTLRGLILSTFRYEASFAEIKELAATYRQCETYYMASDSRDGVQTICPVGALGYGRLLIGIEVAKNLVRLNLLRLQVERYWFPLSKRKPTAAHQK